MENLSVLKVHTSMKIYICWRSDLSPDISNMPLAAAHNTEVWHIANAKTNRQKQTPIKNHAVT